MLIPVICGGSGATSAGWEACTCLPSVLARVTGSDDCRISAGSRTGTGPAGGVPAGPALPRRRCHSIEGPCRPGRCRGAGCLRRHDRGSPACLGTGRRLLPPTGSPWPAGGTVTMRTVPRKKSQDEAQGPLAGTTQMACPRTSQGFPDSYRWLYFRIVTVAVRGRA